MKPNSIGASIEGVSVFNLDSHPDERGLFCEAFRAEWLAGALGDELQMNCSLSRPGVIRGLHYHLRQADYWFLAAGRIEAALVDLREGSPTFLAQQRFEMSPKRPLGIWIPAGVAHGYATLEPASLTYLVNRYFTGEDEYGLAWNDPELAIQWGVESPIVSRRDRNNPLLEELDLEGIGRAVRG